MHGCRVENTRHNSLIFYSLPRQLVNLLAHTLIPSHQYSLKYCCIFFQSRVFVNASISSTRAFCGLRQRAATNWCFSSSTSPLRQVGPNGTREDLTMLMPFVRATFATLNTSLWKLPSPTPAKTIPSKPASTKACMGNGEQLA